MITKTISINIKEGVESRPVAVLVQLASQFKSRINIEQENKIVNAKSIMGMMTLGLVPGQEVKVTADGEDEAEAMNSIESYLCNYK